MFLATFWDWGLPIAAGLLAGVVLFGRKRHDYSRIVTLAPEDFRGNMRRGQLVDLRDEGDYARSHVNGARSFPKRSLFAALAKIRTDMPVFLYDDRQGPRVRAVARRLVRKGFNPVYVLKGGFAAWSFGVKEETK